MQTGVVLMPLIVGLAMVAEIYEDEDDKDSEDKGTDSNGDS